MLYELHTLFKTLQTHKKNRGAFDHRRFIRAVKKANALFDNDEHHDSHEFMSWIIDQIHEDFKKYPSADAKKPY